MYTKRQLSQLRSEYSRNPCLTRNTVERLSTELGVRSTDIYKWFDDQRAYIHEIKALVNWQGRKHYIDCLLVLESCTF